MFPLSLSVPSLLAWLDLHTHTAYLVLFLGAYFETLIGPSFVIPGEVFFIAGGVLASTGVLSVWLVALVIYVGALCGDSSSYFLGRMLGKRIFKPGRFIFSIENYQKGSAFFERHGAKAVFLARIMGPLSWITPFLAGTYCLPYRKFLPYNVAGVFVGVGGFLVAGYFFGAAFVTSIDTFGRYVLIIPLAVAVAAFVWWQVKAGREN